MFSVSNNVLLAVAVVGVAIVAQYVWADVRKGRVQIGLSPDMGADKRHGVAWVKTTDGGATPIPFLADKPELLTDPCSSTIEGIFRQIAKMGMVPATLEVMVGSKVRRFNAA